MKLNIIVNLIGTLLVAIALFLISVPLTIIITAFYLESNVNVWNVWVSLINLALLYGYIESLNPEKYTDTKTSQNGKVIHTSREEN